MRHVKKLTVVFAVALLVLASRSARADEFNHLMIMTFSGPVELPGVALPAGTYQFKVADRTTDRSVIQVLSKDGSHAYATLETTPAQRMTATGDPVVTFEERTAGSPDAIRAIFYPGETSGYRFMYPEAGKDGSASVAHSTQR